MKIIYVIYQVPIIFKLAIRLAWLIAKYLKFLWTNVT